MFQFVLQVEDVQRGERVKDLYTYSTEGLICPRLRHRAVLVVAPSVFLVSVPRLQEVVLDVSS